MKEFTATQIEMAFTAGVNHANSRFRRNIEKALMYPDGSFGESQNEQLVIDHILKDFRGICPHHPFTPGTEDDIPSKAESTVVTPPSPAQVRNEKEKAEEMTDRSLDSQLNDPNLGSE